MVSSALKPAGISRTVTTTQTKFSKYVNRRLTRSTVTIEQSASSRSKYRFHFLWLVSDKCRWIEECHDDKIDFYLRPETPKPPSTIVKSFLRYYVSITPGKIDPRVNQVTIDHIYTAFCRGLEDATTQRYQDQEKKVIVPGKTYSEKKKEEIRQASSEPQLLNNFAGMLAVDRQHSHQRKGKSDHSAL
jgi:hypothetical protein